MILQRVSPVTHSIGNCLKRVIVIVASVIFFQNPMGRQNQIGAPRPTPQSIGLQGSGGNCNLLPQAGCPLNRNARCCAVQREACSTHVRLKWSLERSAASTLAWAVASPG